MTLLLLCDHFFADFAEEFCSEEGRLAVDVGRLNGLLPNWFVLSFWVSLNLLVRGHAVIEDQPLLFLIGFNPLSFVADLIVLRLLAGLPVRIGIEEIVRDYQRLVVSSLLSVIDGKVDMMLVGVVVYIKLLFHNVKPIRKLLIRIRRRI